MQDILGGDPGEPFLDLDRRGQLAAELDVAMLHTYGIRDDAAHVLDSFFVIRKYEERDHGEFRTKGLVLAAYDAMAQAAATGIPFRSPLNPPPGEGPRHTRSSSSTERNAAVRAAGPVARGRTQRGPARCD